MNSASLIIILVVTHLIAVIIGHLITVRSLAGQSIFKNLFKRRNGRPGELSEEELLEESGVPPVLDERWQERETAGVIDHEEPEVEEEYDREISS